MIRQKNGTLHIEVKYISVREKDSAIIFKLDKTKNTVYSPVGKLVRG